MSSGPAFDRAVEKLLRWEGGYVDHPSDPGGETNFGISKRSYPHLDIAALRRADAIEIYRRDWWDCYDYGRIPHEDLAGKVFDLAVNMGPRPAHRLLQHAMNAHGARLVVDGLLGPASWRELSIASSALGSRVLSTLRELAARRYLKLSGVDLRTAPFLVGWLNRAYG